MDKKQHKPLKNKENRHCERAKRVRQSLLKPSPFGGRVWVGDYVIIHIFIVPHLASPKGGGIKSEIATSGLSPPRNDEY